MLLNTVIFLQRGIFCLRIRNTLWNWLCSMLSAFYYFVRRVLWRTLLKALRNIFYFSIVYAPIYWLGGACCFSCSRKNCFFNGLELLTLFFVVIVGSDLLLYITFFVLRMISLCVGKHQVHTFLRVMRKWIWLGLMIIIFIWKLETHANFRFTNLVLALLQVK